MHKNKIHFALFTGGNTKCHFPFYLYRFLQRIKKHKIWNQKWIPNGLILADKYSQVTVQSNTESFTSYNII